MFPANFQNNLQESLHIVTAPYTLQTWAGAGIFDQYLPNIEQDERGMELNTFALLQATRFFFEKTVKHVCLSQLTSIFPKSQNCSQTH